MPEIVNCPQCGRKLTVSETLLGQNVRCPTCGEVFLASVVSQQPSEPNFHPVNPSVNHPPVPMSSPSPGAATANDSSHLYLYSNPPPSHYSGGGDRRYYEDYYEDDQEYDDYPSRKHRIRRDLLPNHGNTILTMGILSIAFVPLGYLCGIFLPASPILGVISWIMGASELKAIHKGEKDPEGKGAVQAGLVCGIIGTGLFVLSLIILVAAVVLISMD